MKQPLGCSNPRFPCIALLASVAVQFSLGIPPAFATESGPPPPAVVAVEIEVQEIRPNLHLLSGAGGNIVVWSGVDGTVLVDSGAAAAQEAVFAAVARIATAPLKFVVNTNGHPEHTGGNAYASSTGAVVIGHESLRLRPARMAGPPGAAAPTTPGGTRPRLTLADAIALHLNGDRVDVIHVADSQTRGDLILRWATADVVALGDIYWNGQYPVIDVSAGGSLAATVAAIEAALARATERTSFVPGHGPVSGRAELAAYRDMLVAVGRNVRENIEQGLGLDEILALHPTAEFDGQFGRGALVSPEEFVRTVHRDLTQPRSAR
jgi:cyclase